MKVPDQKGAIRAKRENQARSFCDSLYLIGG